MKSLYLIALVFVECLSLASAQDIDNKDETLISARVLEGIRSINNNPYLLANLKLLKNNGEQHLKYSLARLAVDSEHKDILLNHIQLLHVMVDWTSHQRDDARQICEEDLNNDFSITSIQRVAFFGNEKTIQMLENIMTEKPFLEKECQESIQHIKNKKKKDLMSMFSKERSEGDQQLLMLALAKSDYRNQAEVSNNLATFGEDEARRLLQFSQDNTLGLRAMLLSTLVEILPKLPKNSDVRNDIVTFAREQVITADKHSQRYAERIVAEEGEQMNKSSKLGSDQYASKMVCRNDVLQKNDSIKGQFIWLLSGFVLLIMIVLYIIYSHKK